MGYSTQQMQFRMHSATNAIEVGATYYFWSSWQQDGASVKVLAKSTDRNSAGWESSVEVEILAPLTNGTRKSRYTPGTKCIMNATNLHKTAAQAGLKAA